MTTRTLIALTFSIGILIVALVLWIARDPQEGPIAEAAWAQAQQEGREANALSESALQPATEHEVRRLRKELARERALRKQLTREIEMYEQQLVVLQNERSELDAIADAAEEPMRRKKVRTVVEEEFDRFNDHVLRAEGLSDTEINRIHRRWEQTAMELQELEDYRARGKKLPEGMGYNAVNQSVREDLGDDGYDAMLYATDQTNRVVVSSVLESSPASAAGLRPGDVIYSYGNQRVFKPMELNRLARLTKLGETIKVEVLGENGLYTRYIESGPSGAIFGSALGRPLGH